jgi:hypothetical protein
MAVIGGGGRRSRDVLDFLADPEKAKAAVDAHRAAADAHTKAADDYKQKRLAALEVLAQLRQKQTEHDERERQLNARHNALDDLNGELNAQIAAYNAKDKELDIEKETFHREQAEFQQMTVQSNQNWTLKMTNADRRHQELDLREAKIEERNNVVAAREKYFNEAVQALKVFSDKLSG